MTRAMHPISDERLDRLVAQLLDERAEDIAVTVLPVDAVLPRIRTGLRRSFPGGQRRALLAAAALLAVVVIGAVVVGSTLVRLGLPPNPLPPALADASTTPHTPPEPRPTLVAGPAGQVLYTVYREVHVGEPGCDATDADHLDTCMSVRIWVANPDGTDARELFPDRTEDTNLIALSLDGSRMIFAAWGGENEAPFSYYLADVTGPEPQVANIELLGLQLEDPTCAGICASDIDFAFSADGTRLAFVRHVPGDPGAPMPDSVVAIMDLASRAVTELGSTAVSWPDGSNAQPAWSPDGTRLIFTRGSIGLPTPEHRLQDTALFVVDVDGANLHQLVPTELFAKDASWSPDGSLIAFTSAVEWLGVDQFGKRENWNVDSEVYTVRPDGSNVQQLTDSGPHGVDRGAPVQIGATFSSWTADGRLLFTLARWAGEGDSTNLPLQLWVMDADGGSQGQLNPSSLSDLTAVGCLTCPYPPEVQGLLYDAYWRAIP